MSGQLAITEPGEALFNERMRHLGLPTRWHDHLGRAWGAWTVTDAEVRRRWAEAENVR